MRIAAFYKKLLSLRKKPERLLIKMLRTASPFLSDRTYLKFLFRLKMGYPLNLKEPRTYNEKLQWQKLYYRDPEIPMMVDKFEVKRYVANLIGNKYVIPTLGVWEHFDDIDFKLLPRQFVLKTTHDQGGVIVCSEKEQLDKVLAKRKIERHLKRNLYNSTKEWPYKNVKPRIIAEKYMVDIKTGELRDYKFFCFDGEPKLMYIASDRQKKGEGIKFNYFDLDFNEVDIRQAYGRAKGKIEKPQTFDKMIEFSRILSQNLPHVRVDFYEINNDLFFGELTFFHHSGLVPFYPQEWDEILGDYFNLS